MCLVPELLIPSRIAWQIFRLISRRSVVTAKSIRFVSPASKILIFLGFFLPHLTFSLCFTCNVMDLNMTDPLSRTFHLFGNPWLEDPIFSGYLTHKTWIQTWLSSNSSIGAGRVAALLLVSVSFYPSFLTESQLTRNNPTGTDGMEPGASLCEIQRPGNSSMEQARGRKVNPRPYTTKWLYGVFGCMSPFQSHLLRCRPQRSACRRPHQSNNKITKQKWLLIEQCILV